MNGSADHDPETGVSDVNGQAGLEQDPTEHSNGPPKEGSNRGYDTGKQARANIQDSISGRSSQGHSDHVDDGRTDETEVDDEEVSNPAQPT